jgi:predicted metal-dependent peptidase
MQAQGADTTRERLTRARTWLSLRYPFFAVLALHLPDTEANVATAQTDGRSLQYNPDYILGLTDEQTRGLILHLVLHAAFGHPWRRGTRDTARWERACDIVVNGVIRKLGGVRLPPGADTTDPALESEAVETVFERQPTIAEPPPPLNGTSGTTQQPSGQAPNAATQADLESYWSEARTAASTVGDVPRDLERHYPTLRSGMRWREHLARYLITATRDYVWTPPDRRMMAHDLIYPSLSGEAARVIVVVDTSGSVSHELIGAFMAEVRAIARSHPDISGLVMYADAAVNGVHDLRRAPPPSVRGGGGTDFTPVWHELERRRERPQVLIYLTDAQPIAWPPRPTYPVVWVVPNSALVTNPPYGEVLKVHL